MAKHYQFILDDSESAAFDQKIALSGKSKNQFCVDLIRAFLAESSIVNGNEVKAE